jgi:hypothetical protein
MCTSTGQNDAPCRITIFELLVRTTYSAIDRFPLTPWFPYPRSAATERPIWTKEKQKRISLNNKDNPLLLKEAKTVLNTKSESALVAMSRKSEHSISLVSLLPLELHNYIHMCRHSPSDSRLEGIQGKSLNKNLNESRRSVQKMISSGALATPFYNFLSAIHQPRSSFDVGAKL